MSSIEFPLRHISVRVPWHDAGWNGSICRYPKYNTSCLKLINIADSKNEATEEAIAGKFLRELAPDQYPPCLKERGTFMASFAIERMHRHPYSDTSPKTHAHFRPTRLHYPAYSAAALPFRWMMRPVVFGDAKRGITAITEQYPLNDVAESSEPELNFDSYWVQDHRNHRALLECFWKHVRLEESLVFFYAKQIPLVEDSSQRVLVGAGRVLKIGPLTEYEYEGSPEGKIRSLAWERMVTHSIRPQFQDGFLLPYHEALENSDEGRAFDPADVVAFAPDDSFIEFSYATEHVGNDAAIGALLSCRNALIRSSDLFDVKISSQLSWIDSQLGRLWKKRGPYPGLGAILGATGISMGNFMAQFLNDRAGPDGDPWKQWDETLTNPGMLPNELSTTIDSTIVKSWQKMPKERREFLKLLSRIDLTSEQANVLAIPEMRKEEGCLLEDIDFMKNPYLVYESTRLTVNPIAIGAVDRGIFPTEFIRNKFPIQTPTAINTAMDARRLRALTIRELESAGDFGNTLLSKAAIVVSLRQHEPQHDEHKTPVTGDLLSAAEDEFGGEIVLGSMKDGSVAYQLARLSTVGEMIRSVISRRVDAPRHSTTIDWARELDALLGEELPKDPEENKKEITARQEKVSALGEIFASRFSILIGPAGTGKTTLLSALCRRTEIQRDRILMLAPTGKARVRMQDLAQRAGIENFQALTLAQFLSGSKPPRYDAATQRYQLINQAGEMKARTVIIDECSMLTEEMLAAVLEALSGVHRLILVGDPRQLPPIGAGRPFADIVAVLRPKNIEAEFPRVGKGYAELTVPRRQGAGLRDDLQLAAWFGGDIIGPGEDQVFEILSGKRSSETIEFIQWETPEELSEKLVETLIRTQNFDSSIEPWQAFGCSLGGQLSGSYVYFNRNRSGQHAEAWQILSPVRQNPWGVETINRALHIVFKANQLATARANVPPWQRRLPKPFGDSQIVYGDKVINLRNQRIRKRRIYPEPEDGFGYLANGEIGVVIGQIKTKKLNYEPKTLQVEFSTQSGLSFEFYQPKGDDDQFSLELAYALTIHKAQGSEFDTVFLSRELLYTALTRQKKKIIVLHQGSAADLQRLSNEHYSSTATRLTNLFGPPSPVAVGEKFLEERLIHRTIRGEAVRSKSEVIIANALFGRRIDYQYEQPLELGGVTKYPDFTIEDDATGVTYYWEHCGLLHDPAYQRRWQEKKNWYQAHNIKPVSEGVEAGAALIETRDRPDGGIDSQEIDKIVQSLST
jgi:AAA domain/UvrD-like helicase C-terminal domain